MAAQVMYLYHTHILFYIKKDIPANVLQPEIEIHEDTQPEMEINDDRTGCDQLAGIDTHPAAIDQFPPLIKADENSNTRPIVKTAEMIIEENKIERVECEIGPSQKRRKINPMVCVSGRTYVVLNRL